MGVMRDFLVEVGRDCELTAGRGDRQAEAILQSGQDLPAPLVNLVPAVLPALLVDFENGDRDRSRGDLLV